MTALKYLIMEQLYFTKKSVEHFHSENVTPNNLELIEALKEEVGYLKNEKITKTYIIKSLIKRPLTGHCHPDRSNSQNLAPGRNNSPKNHDTSKSLSNANVHKSGNNASLKQNKENVKKKRMFINQEIMHHWNKIKKT